MPTLSLIQDLVDKVGNPLQHPWEPYTMPTLSLIQDFVDKVSNPLQHPCETYTVPTLSRLGTLIQWDTCTCKRGGFPGGEAQ